MFQKLLRIVPQFIDRLVAASEEESMMMVDLVHPLLQHVVNLASLFQDSEGCI